MDGKICQNIKPLVPNPFLSQHNYALEEEMNIALHGFYNFCLC